MALPAAKDKTLFTPGPGVPAPLGRAILNCTLSRASPGLLTKS